VIVLRRIYPILTAVVLSCLLYTTAYADDFYENEPISGVFNKNETGQGRNQVPGVDAASAIVMDAVSGRVLYEKNGYSKRAMASITKIMTAVIALEKGNMDDIVTVSKRAASVWGSTINLKAGQKMRLMDLMYGMMLNSGNDAAIAVAEHIGGTVESFLEMMNAKAVEIGAINTSFKSPHGLDAPGHYSTAFDIAVITKYALKNPIFSKIVSTIRASIPGRGFYNTNEMLELYPGADGVKTGYTGQAGRCLVTSATRDNWRIISVVLNSPTRTKRAQSSKSILDYAFINYRLYKLLNIHETIAVIPVSKGIYREVRVQPVENITYPLRADEHDALNTRLELPARVEAPLSEGKILGTIYFEVNGRVFAQSDLKAISEIPRKGLYDYLKDILKAWR